MANSTTTLLAKLQHGGGQVVVLNAPPEFQPVMDKWRADGLPVSQRRTPGSMFVLVFVRNCAEIERLAGSVITSVGKGGVLWFAYPRQECPRYDTDIERTSSFNILGRMGYESIRQVAMDDDWAAMRFQHIDAIRSMSLPRGGAGGRRLPTAG